MLPADIKTATDKELLAHCQPRAWERLYPKVGGLLSALALLVTVSYIGYRFIQGGDGGVAILLVGVTGTLIALALGFVLILGLVLHLTGATERRSRGQRQELKRRYGQDGIDQNIKALQEQMGAIGAPTWAVMFTGQGMPNGRTYWARITLQDPFAQELLLESRIGPRIDFEHGRDPLSQITRREVKLPLSSARELLRFLERQDLEKFHNVKSCFINGLPCEVAILRQGDPAVHRSGCNYVVADNRLNQAPVMRMVGIILRLVEWDVSPKN